MMKIEIFKCKLIFHQWVVTTKYCNNPNIIKIDGGKKAKARHYMSKINSTTDTTKPKFIGSKIKYLRN